MRAIRRRVLALALTLFIALWAVIFVQLITGNDPALSKRSSTTSGSSASGTGSSTSGSGSTASGSATPVTSSQS